MRVTFCAAHTDVRQTNGQGNAITAMTGGGEITAKVARSRTMVWAAALVSAALWGAEGVAPVAPPGRDQTVER